MIRGTASFVCVLSSGVFVLAGACTNAHHPALKTGAAEQSGVISGRLELRSPLPDRPPGPLSGGVAVIRGVHHYRTSDIKSGRFTVHVAPGTYSVTATSSSVSGGTSCGVHRLRVPPSGHVSLNIVCSSTVG